jgi:hypothetical protein
MMMAVAPSATPLKTRRVLKRRAAAIRINRPKSVQTTSMAVNVMMDGRLVRVPD